MARKLIFNGPQTIEQNLVIGNHNHAQIIAKGSFVLEGLIYCPKYSLELIICGEGSILLHGICRRLVLKKVTGNCVINVEDVQIRELSCENLSGKSVVKMKMPKFIIDKNVAEDAKIFFAGERQTIRHSITPNADASSENVFLYSERKAG